MYQLQTQLADLEAQKAQLFEQSSVDQVEVSRLNEKIKAVQVQIAAVETKAVTEERVIKSQEKVAYIFDTIQVGGVPLREYFIDEETYQMVRIQVQGALSDHVEQVNGEFATVESSLREQLLNEKSEREEIQRAKDTQYEELAVFKRTVEQQQAEIEDITSKRDAAVRELESERALTAEKQAHIDTLRLEIANGARNAIRTISEEEIQKAKEEAERKWRDSRIKVTGIRAVEGDNSGRFLQAELLTGENVKFSFLEKGKYLEVSAEEAERFRAEQEANNPGPVETSPVPDPPLVVNPPEVTFPGSPEVPNDNNPGGGEQSLPEVVETPVTRAEFEALKNRVDALTNLSEVVVSDLNKLKYGAA
ncbi:hypothetical protein [Paenibacillus spongiae]|uniref:Uncharacterized protein n=1 Tax=Paenibacillus spongiae TaxID=2909671 RepID=A0ABY5SB77_9BACL|nr:hypothetical protein [Paenibacillus spongiae]UVI31201.1 hypothetical protein L1F29_04985 [Paenibacillus spongiae]